MSGDKKMSKEITTVSVEDLRKVLQAYQEKDNNYNREVHKHRTGKILTIIDSAISDETQRKALKDLINEALYSRPGFGHEFPHLYQAAEALGFQLWETSPEPVEHAKMHNPFKELLK